jgi:hypothetical protein
MAEPAGDLLDRDRRQEIEIELRAQRVDPGPQPQHAGGHRELVQALFLDAGEELPEDAEIVAGAQREAAADDAGLEVDVEEHGDQRLVEARHHHQVIGELVVRPPHPRQVVADRAHTAA